MPKCERAGCQKEVDQRYTVYLNCVTRTMQVCADCFEEVYGVRPKKE